MVLHNVFQVRSHKVSAEVSVMPLAGPSLSALRGPWRVSMLKLSMLSPLDFGLAVGAALAFLVFLKSLNPCGARRLQHNQ